MDPFECCRVLNGSYKWLIWGQDDTAFFPEGIIRALETHQLNADLPHIVSGRLPALLQHSARRSAACVIDLEGHEP